MRLTVLNVAYPLAPAGPDAVGGAEQILAALDSALVEAGHRSIILACEGSRAAGELVTVPRCDGPLEEVAISSARQRHARAIREMLRAESIDVVHLHGVDFHTYLPPAGVPLLATLHLPLDWYPREALYPTRPDTWLQCVSARQHAGCAGNPFFLAPIENGVAVESFRRRAKRDFVLVLSRICPEKGIHIAIEAAKRAEIPLLIAGEVYPYPEHHHYFETEILPRLDAARRFIGPVDRVRKQRLLGYARCLLVPSLVAETSSLVAREALAAGTPVIARNVGALADTLEDGKTGFLVDDEFGMADAIRQVATIDPEACWRAARERFALEPMLGAYLDLYQRLAAAHRRVAAAGLR